MNDNGIEQDIFECKIYINDLETNKKSKEINITDLIFDDNLEFEFGNYEDEDYLQLPYKDFKFFINDYSVTFYSPQYHKLQSNWNSLREWLEKVVKLTANIDEKMTCKNVLNKMNELEGVDNERK